MVVCRRIPRLNRDGGLGCSPHFLWGVGRAYLAPSFLRRGRLVRELARPIHGGRSLSVDFMRAWVGVRRLAAPGFEVGSVGVWG